MEDLRFRHPGGEVFEHVVPGDAKPPDAGLAAALARLDGDALPVVHDREGTAQGPTRSNCGRDQRRLVRRSRLRYLALNGPGIAVISRTRLSRECCCVASDRGRMHKNITPLPARA